MIVSDPKKDWRAPKTNSHCYVQADFNFRALVHQHLEFSYQELGSLVEPESIKCEKLKHLVTKIVHYARILKLRDQDQFEFLTEYVCRGTGL